MFEYSLRCTECDWKAGADAVYGLCPDCGKAPIFVEWTLESSPALLVEVASRPASMWRFREVLPFSNGPITLGEGGTPLLDAPRLASRLGMPPRSKLLFKDESQNPTRSFKSRGMSAAVTAAVALGVERFAVPTAGNAGAALSAYSARAGLEAFIAMPKDTPFSIEEECVRYGATVERVEGVITDAAVRCRDWLGVHRGFDLSTLKEPYRVEGKKTMGYELLLDLGELPAVIVYPTGGGTGLIGMWKAFDEMERLGWIGSERPRMVSAQSAGCAPIVRAFEQGLDHAPEWESPETIAWGLRVPRAVGDRLILKALRESNGTAVAVPDSEIAAASELIRKTEGIDAGEETGAALVAVEQLIESGWIEPGQSVVVFNTGGDKYRN